MTNVNTIQISIGLSGSEKVQHNLEKITGSMQSMGSQAVSLAKDFLYLYGAVKGFQSLVSVLTSGFQFSKEMETAKLGIASIITATQDLITKEGVRLTGIEKLNQAQIIARDLMREIQIAGLQTTATTEELVFGFQALLAPASSAGFTIQQTKDITVMMVQAMGALGITMNQLSAEGRSLLDGSIVPTQDRLATALNITGEMVKKWREQGVLFEELQKRLEPFKIAGVELADTWSGLASNMKEAIAYVGSQISSGLFENIKAGWKTILDSLIDTKNFDIGENIKNIISFINTIATDFGVGLKNTFQYIVELIGQINSYLKTQKDQFAGIWENIKGCVKEFIILIGQVVNYATNWSKILVETGLLQGGLKLIQIALAGINDVIGLLKLGFLTVAWLISGSVLNSIAAVLNLLGHGANWIKKGWGDGLINISQQYYDITAKIEKEMLKTGDQYKNGLLPNLQRVFFEQKNIEKSLEKQNTTTKSIVSDIQSLNKEKEKNKSHADDIAKILEDLADRREMIGKDSMQKELLMLDKKHNEEIQKLIKYNASQEQLEEALYMQRLEWDNKYNELHFGQLIKKVEFEKKLYNEIDKIADDNLKKQYERQQKMLQDEINNRKEIFKIFMEQNNNLGVFSQGFGQITGGISSLIEINVGQDQYTLELERLQWFLNEKIMLYEQGKATIQEIEDAYRAYTIYADEKTNLVRLNQAQAYLTMTAGLLNTLSILFQNKSKAIFYMQKAVAVSQAIISAHLASALALSHPPGPPYTIPLAKLALALGYAQAAAIAATAFMGSGRSAGISGGSAGGYEYTQPNVEKWQEKEEQPKTPSIQVHIYGNVVDHDAFARELVPSLTKAFEDGVK